MTDKTCPNCGTSCGTTYCGECGQKQGPLIPSLRDWLAEAIDEVLLVEARLPRSLKALIWPPGHLTYEWWAGRRAQYVSPLRLYLLLAIPFFLAFSAGPQGGGASLLEFVAFAPVEMTGYEDLLPPQGPLSTELAGDSLAREAWQAEFLRIKSHNDSIISQREVAYRSGSGRVFDAVPILIGLGMVPLLAGMLWSAAGQGFLGAVVLSLNVHAIGYGASFLAWLLGWGLWPGAVVACLALAGARRRLFGEGRVLAVLGALAVAAVYAVSFVTFFAAAAFALDAA